MSGSRRPASKKASLRSMAKLVVAQDIVKPEIVLREEPTAAVVPGAEFAIAGAHEAGIWKGKPELHIVIVILRNGATVESEEAPFAYVLLEMQIFNSAERIALDSGALHEGRFVALDPGIAESELDPVAVVSLGFRRLRRFDCIGGRRR
jgi:hypothetical protein